MMKVKLFTKSNQFIGSAELPPYKTMPEVLIWGERFFVYVPTTSDIYREACAVTLTQGVLNDQL